MLEPHMAWRPGSGLKNATLCYALTRTEEGLRVDVFEPGHGVMLDTPNPLRLDPRQTPILGMKYRATGLDLADPNEGVLVFWGGKPRSLSAVLNSDLACDGEVHEVWLDLREGLPGNEINGDALVSIDLRVRASAQGPAVFTLLDLRFEPDGPVVVPPEAEEQASPIRVRAIDRDGKPLAGATVTLDCHTRNLRVTAKTDKDGYATVTPAFPGLAGTRQSVLVAKEGMASVLFSDLKGVGPTTELEARLCPVQTLSGCVVDEDGKPVARATGDIWDSGSPRSPKPGCPWTVWDKHVVSDAEGRWSCSFPPERDGQAVQVRWGTIGYVRDVWGGQRSGRLAMADLRSGAAVSILRRGTDVSGVVTNEAGQPIEGAKVAQGEHPSSSNSPPAAVTDENGGFLFRDVSPETLVLTVTARGYAPELVEAGNTTGLTPIRIVLRPSHTFRFRVVDTQGAPVPGVNFLSDRWRGHRTISQQVTTDAKGLATWQGPEDSVEFTVFAKNWMNQNVTAGPSAGEGDIVEVVMHGPLTVTIHATDAETNQPLEQFTVVQGALWRNEGVKQLSWQPAMDMPPGKDGEWKLISTNNCPFLVFRVEAEGYAPVVSTPVAKDAGTVELAVRLTRAEPMRLKLVNEKGEPVPGATVYLNRGRNGLEIRNGTVEDSKDCLTCRADEQGHVSFPPQAGDFLLVVADRRGYAKTDAEGIEAAKGTITLRPWATLTGTLLVGNTPRAGETVRAGVKREFQPGKPYVYHALESTTAEDGSFRIDGIPPGKVTVGRFMQTSEHWWGSSLTRDLELQPGQTLAVNLGGTGRPIVGKFVWARDAEPIGFRNSHQRFLSIAARKIVDELRDRLFPKDYRTWDAERRKAWKESKEGKEALERMAPAVQRANARQPEYAFAIADDGTFRIDNVEPGTYGLYVTVLDKPRGGQQNEGEPRGTCTTEVVVPPFPEGVTYLDTPLDLGELPVEPVKPTP